MLGGLVPALLCSGSRWRHAGTVDVDVQVDLEIACGAVNMGRLEQALRNAEFEPDARRAWRWVKAAGPPQPLVKFELLADLDTEHAGDTIHFVACERLGAVNLRGTRFAALDVESHQLTAKIGGSQYRCEVKVAGLAGFLLAKAHAAHGRRAPKDWYDIAFVLLNNDLGGVRGAIAAVQNRFGHELHGSTRTALDDLLANFADRRAQGVDAYAWQMLIDYPARESTTVVAEAMAAVERFHAGLFPSAESPDRLTS